MEGVEGERLDADRLVSARPLQAGELDAPDWQPIEIKRTPWQERLKSGDRVYVRGISQPVEVITPPDPSGSPAQAQRVEVLLGTMRAKIPVYQLQRLAEGHPAAARQGVYLDRAATRTPAPRRPASAWTRAVADPPLHSPPAPGAQRPHGAPSRHIPPR